ncbi:MAG: nuclease-related domain-containing protein [Chloroflexota bacterium]|nr:nuclease-related domain-containing protein [Chloroflexota bacterium]
MKIVANESYIEKRIKMGEFLPLASLGLLGGSLALTYFKPEWTMVTMVMVLLGFFASIAGSYYVNRFNGNTPMFKEIPKLLKGLSDEYALLMYKLPAPFVLVGPGGLTAIKVKNQSGDIGFHEGRWHHAQRMKFLRQFGGEESLGKPDEQAFTLAQDLEEYLAQRLPDDVTVPVQGIALFINPAAQLDTAESPVPVLWSKELKGWLRNKGRRPALPKETRRVLTEALEI